MKAYNINDCMSIMPDWITVYQETGVPIQCHEERERHHCLSQEEGIGVAHPFNDLLCNPHSPAMIPTLAVTTTRL